MSETKGNAPERGKPRSGATPLDPKAYHQRNAAVVSELEGLCVVIFGAGSVSSHAAPQLAKSGVNLVLVDGDKLEVANLHRHTAGSRYLGRNKADALAATIKEEIPEKTRVHWIGSNTDQLPPGQMPHIVSAADVVIAATGNRTADREIERVCRDAGVPMVVPSMHAGAGRILGDILVVPYSPNRSRDWGMACLTCLHPAPRARNAERLIGAIESATAQPGLEVDVATIANSTTMLTLALLLPESERGRWLVGLLDEDVNAFMIPRTSPSWRLTRTERRARCANCQPSEEATRRQPARESVRSAPTPRVATRARHEWPVRQRKANSLRDLWYGKGRILAVALIGLVLWFGTGFIRSAIHSSAGSVVRESQVHMPTTKPARARKAVVKPKHKPKLRCSVYRTVAPDAIFEYSTPTRYLASEKRKNPGLRVLGCIFYEDGSFGG